MDTSAIIVMVLAIVVVGTECRSPPYHPPPVHVVQECERVRQQCTAELQGNSFIGGQLADFQTMIANIDQVCGEYQPAAVCIRSAMNVCDYGRFRDQFVIGLSVGDFLCSEHGKSLLRAYQESTCYHNPMALNELQIIIQTCTYQVSSQAENAEVNCEQIEEIHQCVAQVVRESCGETTVELVTGIFHRILPLLSRQSCSYSATNDALKRAFNLFKKSL